MKLNADKASSKSQPFFQRYKSNKPTSLTLHYSIRSGVSNCGDLMRILVRIIQGNTPEGENLIEFLQMQGHYKRHLRQQRLSSACRNSCIQLLSFILTPLCTAIVRSTTVLLLLRRTENSSRAFVMHFQYKINVTVSMRQASPFPLYEFRNINLIPFREYRTSSDKHH